MPAQPDLLGRGRARDAPWHWSARAWAGAQSAITQDPAMARTFTAADINARAECACPSGSSTPCTAGSRLVNRSWAGCLATKTSTGATGAANRCRRQSSSGCPTLWHEHRRSWLTASSDACRSMVTIGAPCFAAARQRRNDRRCRPVPRARHVPGGTRCIRGSAAEQPGKE
jgi:hypothetical protein